MRFLLLALLASGVLASVLDEDLRTLEDLEDLLVRDVNKEMYISDGKKARTAEGLLRHFNSAKGFSMNKAKLEKHLMELEEEKEKFSKLLTEEEIDERISEVKLMLHNRKSCRNRKYRRIDGSCNNLQKPEQGAAETPLIRLINNDYDDSLSQPRSVSVNGGDLPNAREISRTVMDNEPNRKMADFTTLSMHVGQLTDHDLTAVHSQEVDCSGCLTDNECLSIMIDGADPVFGGVQSCFPFHRSNFKVDSQGVRQQVNSITHYLDASMVYGSDSASANNLKDDNRFLLKHLTDSVTGRELLPPDMSMTDPECTGRDDEAGIFCGLAGDGRVAEQPGLTALHTLFLREHNRIAKGLRSLDPSWGRFKVYQTARKILTAEWQHIVYNEYLPLIVSANDYENNDLSPNKPYHYNPDVDASQSNVFAAAAFRFGHSKIVFNLARANKNYRVRGIPRILLNEAFFNTTYIFDTSIADGALDSILRGMTVQQAQRIDRQFADAVTDNLFGDPDVKGDGMDLIALNIQRARDHGVPSYNAFRDLCNLERCVTINQLRNRGVIGRVAARRLKNVYGNNGLDDIDPFVGFVVESHVANTEVGPSLSCIFGDQFKRLKFGDRFFYQNEAHFSPDQINEIKKATMARLFCDNVEAVEKIQPFVFVRAKNFALRKRDTADGDAADGEDADGEDKERSYDSFHEYSKSGSWPHKREFVVSGLDNRRVSCDAANGNIPMVDLSIFL